MFSRYLKVFVLALGCLASATAGLNWLIDPYLIFGSPRIDGLNDIKSEINEHVILSKKYHPLLQEWDRLIVGNSRVEMGLNPEHECFARNDIRVYNLGIPGAGVRKQLEYALNVMYQQNISEVYLSLDFVDFIVPESSSPPVIDGESVSSHSELEYLFDGSRNPDFLRSVFVDKYRALFSLDALTSSVATVLSQDARSPNRTESGFNPANDFLHATKIEGVEAIFDQKMASLRSRLSRQWALKYSDGTPVRAYSDLREFLRIAEAKGIRVTLFTNPFHQEFWQLLESQGLKELHDRWLQDVRIIAEQAEVKVALWDFSSDSRFIHEEVENGVLRKTPLKWFWEPAHYKSELGDLMLGSMLGARCDVGSGFGVRLL